MRAFPALLASLSLTAFALADDSRLPLALRGVNPDRLSGGVYQTLVASGAFGPAPAVAADVVVAGPLKGRPPVVLDARVGANLRLGADPTAIATNPQQAEPHIFRSASNGQLLLATFQEGRFNDAGALDCGYALSTDGGFTWTRTLIPRLTQLTGGRYFRATDPVAAIGPQGDLYLNTLGALDNAFNTSAVVVSRSLDGGTTWSDPVVVAQSSSAQVMADKNWIAVNDYPLAPNAGRLVVTWTNFTSDALGRSTGNNLLAALSDDRGVTWSAPVAITPAGASNQGSQPVFLPDGSLAVVYFTFANTNSTSLGSIQCNRSTDGGRTFPSAPTVAVATVNAWDDPDLRDGVYLPAATAARQSGDLFVAYTAVVSGSPRVLVVKSTDRGATWSAPVIASDNPAGVSVVNPAIAVTPDGRTITVVFYDKRNAADGHNFVDLYAALSLDGGTTWQPNVRLTEFSSDIRYAQPTPRGYMLGDYLGLAPTLASDQNAIAIWCDTRNGQSDPFVVQATPAAAPSYAAWRLAHFPRADLANASLSGDAADPDGDGYPNLFEYALGGDPRSAESGSPFSVNSSFGVVAISETLPANRPDVTLAWESSLDGRTWSPAVGVPTFVALPPGSWLLTAGTDQPTFFRQFAQLANGTKLASNEPCTVSGDGRLISLSTRGQVKTGASQLIVGFATDGAKQILLRGVGPSLRAYGVAQPIGDPLLRLFPAGATVPSAQNDNWLGTGLPPPLTLSAALVRLGAFPLSSNNESALFVSLPGGSYTAIVSDVNSAAGLGLVEAYDADPVPGAPAGPRLASLSTRGEVGAGDNALIAGFVLGGTQPRRVLIRAVGPTLSQFGVVGALADPVLQLFRTGENVPFAANDDWALARNAAATSTASTAISAFSLPANSLDAALVLTLAPGAYTAIVTSATDATGLALVEVYDAN